MRHKDVIASLWSFVTGRGWNESPGETWSGSYLRASVSRPALKCGEIIQPNAFFFSGLIKPLVEGTQAVISPRIAQITRDPISQTTGTQVLSLAHRMEEGLSTEQQQRVPGLLPRQSDDRSHFNSLGLPL